MDPQKDYPIFVAKVRLVSNYIYFDSYYFFSGINVLDLSTLKLSIFMHNRICKGIEINVYWKIFTYPSLVVRPRDALARPGHCWPRKRRCRHRFVAPGQWLDHRLKSAHNGLGLCQSKKNEVYEWYWFGVCGLREYLQQHSLMTT